MKPQGVFGRKHKHFSITREKMSMQEVATNAAEERCVWWMREGGWRDSYILIKSLCILQVTEDFAVFMQKNSAFG